MSETEAPIVYAEQSDPKMFEVYLKEKVTIVDITYKPGIKHTVSQDVLELFADKIESQKAI